MKSCKFVAFLPQYVSLWFDMIDVEVGLNAMAQRSFSIQASGRVDRGRAFAVAILHVTYTVIVHKGSCRRASNSS